MSKYQPLGDFLRRQKADVVTLRFEQIEEIVGFNLPHSRDNPAWWSNNPDNNVMTRVWLDAGFRVRNVRLKEREATFYRIAPSLEAADEESIQLGDLTPVARGVLTVLARRSGRTLAKEALAVLSEALDPRPVR